MLGMLAALLGTSTTVQAAPAAASQPIVHLTVLGTTDIHGHIFPTTYFPGDRHDGLGLASIYTLVKRIRKRDPQAILVDSGDVLQGSPLTTYHATVLHGRGENPMIACMNAMGYSGLGVGNHDFNYGLPYLDAARSEANFPFLSANVMAAGTQRPYFRPYRLLTVKGVRVGIIGFTTPGVAIWDRRNVEGKLQFEDIVASAKRFVPEMKREGADVIIAIPHSGLGGSQGPAYEGYSAASGLPPENVCEALARAVPQIDVIFAGHTHMLVPGEVINGVDIVEADKWGTHLAEADLALEKAGGRWHVVSKHTETLSTKGVPPAPELTRIAGSIHRATLAYMAAPLARTPVAWSTADALVAPSTLLELIGQVERQVTGAELAAVSPFTTSEQIAPGTISEADVAALYPYENDLLSIRISGKQLKDYLEYAARFYEPYRPGAVAFDPHIPAYNCDSVIGVDYVIDVAKPVGHRILDLRYQGRPVKPIDTFTMALNSYRQHGGGGFTMVVNAPVVYDHELSIRELIGDYLRRHPEIRPSDLTPATWRLAPAGAIAPDGRYREPQRL